MQNVWTALGKKLFLSLVVLALMLCSLLPEGRDKQFVVKAAANDPLSSLYHPLQCLFVHSGVVIVPHSDAGSENVLH